MCKFQNILICCTIAVVVQIQLLAESLVAQQTKDAEVSNAIQEENNKPGSTDWQLTRVRLDKNLGFRSPWIEGYCSRQSVSAGEKLDIMVSTNPKKPFKIEIFRTGYYGGRGARLMTTLGPLEGRTQKTPEPDGERRLVECHWEASASIVIPKDWLSGVYLGRLTTVDEEKPYDYWQSYVVFVVRDDRPADILFQVSDNTWQAYNRWPVDTSVYLHPKGNQGPWADVSFDRPYSKYAQIYENPQSIGSGEWLCFEFPFAFWLEQQGYNVSYCSNSDMLVPDRGLKCKAMLSVGHDMRASLKCETRVSIFCSFQETLFVGYRRFAKAMTVAKIESCFAVGLMAAIISLRSLVSATMVRFPTEVRMKDFSWAHATSTL